MLDCGGCLLENAKTCIFTCENSGGDGSFQVMPPADLSLNGEDKDQASQEDGSNYSFIVTCRCISVDYVDMGSMEALGATEHSPISYIFSTSWSCMQYITKSADLSCLLHTYTVNPSHI